MRREGKSEQKYDDHHPENVQRSFKSGDGYQGQQSRSDGLDRIHMGTARVNYEAFSNFHGKGGNRGSGRSGTHVFSEPGFEGKQHVAVRQNFKDSDVFQQDADRHVYRGSNKDVGWGAPEAGKADETMGIGSRNVENGERQRQVGHEGSMGNRQSVGRSDAASSGKFQGSPDEKRSDYSRLGGSPQNVQGGPVQGIQVCSNCGSGRSADSEDAEKNSFRRDHHQTHYGRYKPTSQTTWDDSALYQERSARSCSTDDRRKGTRPTNAGPAGKTCRSFGVPPEYSEVSGQFDGTGKPIGNPHFHDVSELQEFADAEWGYPEYKDQARFAGHSILRRTHTSRVAKGDDIKTIPLQQVGVPVLDLEEVVSMMNKCTRERFTEVWNNLAKVPTDVNDELHGDWEEPRLGIPDKDARILMDAGIIQLASEEPTKGWVTPFSVVEDKPTGSRRRFIAWPRAKNLHDQYEAQVPLKHISAYLDAVHQESAALCDLKASFFQIALPFEARKNFRCRTESGTLVELTRLPMGYKCSPEILNTVSRVLAGEAQVVKEQFAAPRDIRIDVWIDNIRLCGDRKSVADWEKRVYYNMEVCKVTLGEKVRVSEKYDFLGVSFDRKAKTVALTERNVEKLKQGTRLENINIRELEALTARMLHASAVRGMALFKWYFFLKMVRRRLSRINRGQAEIDEQAFLPPMAIALGNRWRSILEENVPVQPPKILPRSATLVTDASLKGWGAMLFKHSGETLIAGGPWKETPNMIAQAEARAVQLGLRAFYDELSGHLDVWIDNTTIMNVANKGHTKSEALALEGEAIDNLARKKNITVAYHYVKSADNPADGLSRGQHISMADLAKGRILASESDGGGLTYPAYHTHLVSK